MNATPPDERFELLDAIWRRWQRRPSFQAAYADRHSGVAGLDAQGAPDTPGETSIAPPVLGA